MEYAVVADGLPRPLTADEVEALIRRLDQTGLTRRDVETGAVLWRTPAAHAAAALREQRNAGEKTLTIPGEDRGTVLAVLHSCFGEPDFSERLMELRYALHAELAEKDEAA